MCLSAGPASPTKPDSSRRSAGHDPSSAAAVKGGRSHGYYVDLEDPRALVGWADNVFLGQVIQAVGPAEPDPMPQTLFKVRPWEVLKGAVPREVIVAQQLGPHPETGDLLGREGDQPLKIGQVYMFSTRTHRNGTWETPAALVGNVLTTRDTVTSVTKDFIAAAANPIPFSFPNPKSRQ